MTEVTESMRREVARSPGRYYHEQPPEIRRRCMEDLIARVLDELPALERRERATRLAFDKFNRLSEHRRKQIIAEQRAADELTYHYAWIEARADREAAEYIIEWATEEICQIGQP